MQLDTVRFPFEKLVVVTNCLFKVYKYAIAGTLSATLQVPFIMWGVVALTGIELLYFFSIPFLRQRCYPLFLMSHLLGLFLFMLGVCMRSSLSFDAL